jgi:hypothetical protein
MGTMVRQRMTPPLGSALGTLFFASSSDQKGGLGATEELLSRAAQPQLGFWVQMRRIEENLESRLKSDHAAHLAELLRFY